MKYFFSALLIFIISSHAHAQGWQWGKGAASNGEFTFNYSNSVVVDANGNVYQAGTFQGDSIVFGNDTLYADGWIFNENILLEQSLHIYPNPATISLTIQSTNAIEELIVTNLLGQTVYNQHGSTSLTKNIDVSAWPPGIYFVKVNGVVQKFIKE